MDISGSLGPSNVPKRALLYHYSIGAYYEMKIKACIEQTGTGKLGKLRFRSHLERWALERGR